MEVDDELYGQVRNVLRVCNVRDDHVRLSPHPVSVQTQLAGQYAVA